jgi:hypothetical protein
MKFNNAPVCACGDYKQAVDLVLAEVEKHLGSTHGTEHCLFWFVAKSYAYAYAAEMLVKLAEKGYLSEQLMLIDAEADRLLGDHVNLDYMLAGLQAIFGAALEKKAGRVQ